MLRSGLLQRAMLTAFGMALFFIALSSRTNPNGAQAFTDEKTPAERGLYNLTHKGYGFPLFNQMIFERLWTVWEPEWKSRVNKDDKEQIRRLTFERYGFAESPYAKGGAPVQFVATPMGWVQTCMLCHGGKLPGSGETMIGLPNSDIDMQTLYEDVTKLIGIKPPFKLNFGMTRGRTNAFVFSAELMRRRNLDLSMRSEPVSFGTYQDIDLDAVPWWHFKKKTSLYVDGGVTGDFTRPIMQFTMGEPDGAKIRSWEADFKDIVAYLRTIEPPKYPFPIDQKLAAEGKKVFERTCSECHGTYGANGKYPNRVVPIAAIGTDSMRLTELTKEMRSYFNRTWFAANARAEENPAGYVAPPLDGVWATAPYFHNGAVPTVYGVLTKEARPKYFRRTGSAADYDAKNLGLPYETLTAPAAATLPGEARRRVVDTTLPGLGNQGHPFGFPLSEKQKRQVIEYLKTL